MTPSGRSERHRRILPRKRYRFACVEGIWYSFRIFRGNFFWPEFHVQNGCQTAVKWAVWQRFDSDLTDSWQVGLWSVCAWFFEHLGCSDDFLTMINRFSAKFPIDIGGRKIFRKLFFGRKQFQKIFFEKVKISKNHRKFQLFPENFHKENDGFPYENFRKKVAIFEDFWNFHFFEKYFVEIVFDQKIIFRKFFAHLCR